MPSSEGDTYIVLSVGPTGQPRTGQAIATETWIENSAHDIVPLNNNFEGQKVLARVVRALVLPFQIFRETRRSRPAAMYLSMKRSLFGIAADLACVIVYHSVLKGPVVVHLHGADLASARKSRFKNAMIRRLWGAVTDVIILSPKMEAELEGLPERRIHIVRNFSETFATVDSIEAKVSAFQRAPLRVLYLSNIMFTKGFSYLVDAVWKLRAGGLEVTLTLAGKPLDDCEMKAEDAFARLKEGLGEGIEYVGAVDGDQKRELLTAAHVVALPTFYPIEAQPISLIEGMAFGCIPLATRHNYNEDFLDPCVAILVDKRSASAIAESLRELVANPGDAAARMRLASVVARNKHSVSHFVNSLDRVLDNAIQNNSCVIAETPGACSTQADYPEQGNFL